MLIDVQFKKPDPTMAMILSCISDGAVQPERIALGMYSAGHWNLGDMIDWPIVEHYPSFPDTAQDGPTLDAPYGVCDSPEQFRDYFGDQLDDVTRHFVVSFVQIRRDSQSPDGGWRWHKWGPYIGKHAQTMEYLYDEPEVEVVWTYHIYELLDERCGICSACEAGEPCLEAALTKLRGG